ncbi:hypothetical protein K0A96_00250 [Patescibacteria group bacterium]|nr:hypothetical protein [Patescibacteria group bacterium]
MERCAAFHCDIIYKHQASSIKHQASSIKHQASSIKHQASSIKHQASKESIYVWTLKMVDN